MRKEQANRYRNSVRSPRWTMTEEERQALCLVAEILDALSEEDKETFCAQAKDMSFYDLQTGLAKQGRTLRVVKLE